MELFRGGSVGVRRVGELVVPFAKKSGFARKNRSISSCAFDIFHVGCMELFLGPTDTASAFRFRVIMKTPLSAPEDTYPAFTISSFVINLYFKPFSRTGRPHFRRAIVNAFPVYLTFFAAATIFVKTLSTAERVIGGIGFRWIIAYEKFRS
jgi:hypothetical protein